MDILVITDDYFYFGSGTSSRFRHFCKMFDAMGLHVHVIAYRSIDSTIVPNQLYYWENIEYEIATQKNSSSYETFFGIKNFWKSIEKYIENNSVDFIFSAICPAEFERILKISKKHAIPLFIEQNEWFEYSNFKFKWFDLRFIRRNYIRKKRMKLVNGAVVISRLLDSYYKSKGLHSIRIPTILDVKETEYSLNTHNEKIVIVYTGNCGKSKENLRPMVEVLAKNEKYREVIEFHIYGPTKETVESNIGDSNLIKEAANSLVIHGRVPQTDIENIIREADYQLFIRPVRRSSNAGFPTKLAESMLVGTPVITNDTGDIGLYLKSERNGFLLNGNKTEELLPAIEKVIEIKKDKIRYIEMRKSARQTAEQSFDYRNYVEDLKEFLKIF